MTRKRYEPLKAPMPHQVASIAEMRRRPLANFDDPGMGKAKQAYDTIALLFQDREIDLAIVAMSSALKGNFMQEVANDADQLIARVVEGSKSERLKFYKYPGCHILIISYETLVRDLTELKCVLQKYRVYFGLDEAHRIKNLDTQTSKAALALSEVATKTAVFTGTPMPNRVKDIFPLLRFLRLDVGSTLDEFWAKYSSLEKLRSFIIDNSVRRRKDSTPGIGVPKKSYEKVTVQLTNQEMRYYAEIANEVIAEILDNSGRKKIFHIRSVLTRLLRLTQFTSNPKLLGIDCPQSKMAKLNELVARLLKDPSEKVVIWTSYRENVFEVCRMLSEFEPVMLIGGKSRDELMEAKDRFQENARCRVLVAIPACAREGFTLTKSRYAIYLDRNFSALDWLQSQDRIHRISQTRPVKIFSIEAEGTLDQRIDEVLSRKEAVQSYLIGDQDELIDTPYFNASDVEQLVRQH